MQLAYILFFVDGPAPTPQDFIEASQMPAKVVFRNARAVPMEPHSLEQCDGVAGCVPQIYADKFATARDAIYKKADELRALAEKVGDSPAPSRKAAAKAAAKPADATDTPAAATPAAPATPPAWNPNPA